MPKCEHLLEGGGGTGAPVGRSGGKVLTLLAVDHSPAMLAEARQRAAQKRLQNVEFRLGEMSHLPFRWRGRLGGTDMVLHHAPRPALVLCELARVLRTQGGDYCRSAAS
ncbi:MAG: class I SAM-dependent methyltransferase [Syntrophotaleaceae bacterium]